MDELFLWSWSQTTTDTPTLEAMLVSYRDLDALLRRGAEHELFREAMVLSTCNRLELYATSPAEPPRLLQWLVPTALGPAPPPGRMLQGADVARHLFRVTTGLESLRTGEVEIHAQVRSAAAAARHADTLGPNLRALLDRAVAVSRSVRQASGLDTDVPSLGGLVAHVLRSQDVRPPATVAVVGSGHLARSVLADLHTTGYTTVVSTRRPHEVARRLTGAQRVFPLLHLEQTLERVDAAVFATSVAHTVLDVQQTRHLLERRHGRPIVLVDLGVPNNVTADVGAIDGADLHTLAAINATSPGPSLAVQRRAARQVDDEVEAFRATQMLARHTDDIVDLRNHVHQVIADQLAAGRTQTSDADLERIARSLANKILHQPTQMLKAAIVRNDEATISLIRECFGLASIERAGSAVDPHPSMRAAG